MRRWLACFVQLLFISALSFSQELANPSRHVSQTVPVSSSRTELSAERSQAEHPEIAQPSASGSTAQGNSWQLLTTLPGVIIHDISFASAKVGYAVGEQGQVWKTTDGGSSWLQQALSNAGSDYFYGVDALSSEKVIITGFFDGSSGAYGVFRWTEDGGRVWSSDLSPGPEWLQQVRFVKGKDGIMMPLGPAAIPRPPPNTRPMEARAFPIGRARWRTPRALGLRRNSRCSTTCMRGRRVSISAPALPAVRIGAAEILLILFSTVPFSF